MINRKNFDCAFKILELQINILNLKLQQMKSGDYRCNKELTAVNSELCMLMKITTKYDFISRISSGSSLLVGEGNLSFTISLMKKLQQLPRCITSTNEDYNDLSDLAKLNTFHLKKLRINVLHNINATKLDKTFNHNSLDTIIFQFPHSGSRDPIDGLNPNYVLVRNFIISASYLLKKYGIILITIVDSDFYNSMFQLKKLSQELKIPMPIKYKFDLKDYPEYMHTMTNQDESAIEEYSKFATWEFKL